MTNTNCSKCGKAVRPGDKFCPACGHPVDHKTGDSRPGLNDQYIVLGILIIAALIYVGYQVLTPRSDPHQGLEQAENPASMPVDIEGFTQNLPDDFASLVSMGNALMDQSNYELATICYERALEQNPKDVSVIVDLGACWHALGQNEKAIENFEKALEYEPGHLIAMFNMGIVYHTTGDQEQAVAWWKRLLSENPPPELKQRTEELIQQMEGN